ncbi:MAG: hypothetical protein Q7J60_05635, partial [Bradyrhizobium sp.]|nr:hypothetical protein [Bradyrhizobium sp.]
QFGDAGLIFAVGSVEYENRRLRNACGQRRLRGPDDAKGGTLDIAGSFLGPATPAGASRRPIRYG